MSCYAMSYHVISCHVNPSSLVFSLDSSIPSSSHIVTTVHSHTCRSHVRNPVRTLNAISRAMSMLRSKITDLDQNTVLQSVTDLKEVQNSDFDKNEETQNSVEMGESVYRENGSRGTGTDSELVILIK